MTLLIVNIGKNLILIKISYNFREILEKLENIRIVFFVSYYKLKKYTYSYYKRKYLQSSLRKIKLDY